MMAQPPDWLPSVYLSGAFTDLTITCANEKFQVHGVVVCSQSSFFDTACSKRWAETEQPTVDLAEDDVEIVRRMIEFFYRAEYADFEFEGLKQHAKVFSISVKYDVEKLGEMAIEKFRDTSNRRWNQKDFLNSIPTVYLDTPDEAHKLRNNAVYVACTHFASLGKGSDVEALWRETCTSVPAFPFDLLQIFQRLPNWRMSLS
ncbi:BTB/POZ domain-containing protein [Cladophialophora immunda]|nr:BTB/POZ domain-containing protein [Cladophialophora immunda]